MNKSSQARRHDADARQRNSPGNFESVRAQVSEKTRRLHEALHVHPVLSRISTADLNADQYLSVLSRYLTFFIAVESRRVASNLFAGQSLMGDISLLSADTKFIPDDLPRLPPVDNKWACLGMLYVLHGARFGARVMQTKLRERFPQLPHHFFSQDTTPEQWRLLVLQMERAADDPQAIADMTQSAAETFEAFGDWVMGADLGDETS